ncbi:hypothetical protein K4F52_005957 [Lecanicillium sp. MT-2017a]|nr:hypothetical protein K4F52_005957 [Lecanicillium sp. MT-2017a]
MDEQPNQSRHGMSGSVPPPGNSRLSPSVHHHRRFDESWVELSSQPSSSSLSSVGDEIVTTGLAVGSSPFQRRRRLQHSARSAPIQQQTTIHAMEPSSQDEEEESESEEDQVMSSSAENIHSSERDASDGSEEDSDDDADNATALGRNSDVPVFQPHPNAFSHPPAGLGQRSHSTNSSLPPHPHSEFRRASYPHRSHTRVHRGAPSFMSPSAREDNDAALRASLTTLLSCAAAARGLPKSKEETAGQRATRTGVGPSNQPMELRFIQESDLAGESTEKDATAEPPRARRASPSRSPTNTAVSDKSKRSGSAGRSPRATKKKKTAAVTEDALISPTLLTWVVSAGVVVLVSVVGFGAGYVMGREVGRQEAQEALAASVGGVNDTTSASREVIRSSGGLRKLRWGAVGRSIVAQA